MIRIFSAAGCVSGHIPGRLQRERDSILLFVVAAESGFHIPHLQPEPAWRAPGFGPEELAEIKLIRKSHPIGNFRDPQGGINQKVFRMKDQDIIPILNRRAAVKFPEMPEKSRSGHFAHPGQFSQVQFFPGRIQLLEQRLENL